MEETFGKRSKHGGDFGEEYRAKVKINFWKLLEISTGKQPFVATAEFIPRNRPWQ
jgi:hypothetical protein